jgi:hypothetical protein
MTAARKLILHTTGHSFPPLIEPTKGRKRGKPEEEFQFRVIQAAKRYGYLVSHSRPSLSQSGRWHTAIQGDKGFLDLVLAKAGDVIIAELKSDNGRLTPEQKLWIVALGGLAVVWRPRDWDAILARLSGKAGQ